MEDRDCIFSAELGMLQRDSARFSDDSGSRTNDSHSSIDENCDNYISHQRTIAMLSAHGPSAMVHVQLHHVSVRLYRVRLQCGT